MIYYMKHFFDSAKSMTAGLLCLALTGCQTHKSTTTLGDGYKEIDHPTHTFLPGENPPRISLDHAEPDGSTKVIWPSLYCHNDVEKDDVVVFVAEEAFLNAGQASIHPRLFAARYPGVPVDITEPLLTRWAAANGKDVSKTLNRYSLATPEEKDNSLVVHFEFWSGSFLAEEDWPQTGDLTLNWADVTKMMDFVEINGLPKKDPRWHTPFISE